MVVHKLIASFSLIFLVIEVAVSELMLTMGKPTSILIWAMTQLYILSTEFDFMIFRKSGCFVLGRRLKGGEGIIS